MTSSSGPGDSSSAQARLGAPDVQGAFRGRTLGVALVGRVLVVVHNSQPPAQDEWVRYCALVGAHHDGLAGQFIIAEGPGPNAIQRQQSLNRLPKGYAIPPSAVLTRSVMVRGIVNLFNWFTPRAMRAFPPEDLSAAAQHLGMTDAQVQRLMDLARLLMPDASQSQGDTTSAAHL
ncbi:STAS/SEC14 domain-containing protein [Pyxidicoccus sp. 3LFB2]